MSNAPSAESLKMSLVLSGAKNLSKLRSKHLTRYLAACAFAFGALPAAPASAAPFAYVTNSGEITVSILDLSNGTTVATIPTSNSAPTDGSAPVVGIDSAPIGVALNPAGTFAYVVNLGDGTDNGSVSVIDTSTNKVTASVTVGLKPQLLTVSPDGKTVYVTNLGGSVSVIDTATNKETTKIEVANSPTGIALSPDGSKLYVTQSDRNQMSVIDTATQKIVATVPVGNNPLGVVVNPAGTFAYVANYGLTNFTTGVIQVPGNVSVVDTATNTVVATVAVPVSSAGTATIAGVAINSTGSLVYVTDSFNDLVDVIDTKTNGVSAVIPVGITPFGISIDSNGTYAYVCNSGDGTISVVNLSLNIVSATMTPSGDPIGPLYNAITNSAALSINPDQHGLTGAWYDPAANGQGFMIEVYPDTNGTGNGTLAAGWFTYDVTAAGGQRWFSLQGPVSGTPNSAGVYPTAALDILTATGGNFNAPPIVTGPKIGEATIRFVDCGHAILTYNFSDGSSFSDGSKPSGTIPLLRITGSPTCSASGDTSAAAGNFLLSGSWFNPATSGQGFMLEVNPAQTLLSASWFTYAPDSAQTGGAANQRWYTLQTNQFASGATSASNVPIYTGTGGVFYDPTKITTSQVGTANVTFQSCGAMTVDYTFTSGTNQGQTGTATLSRAGPIPNGCSL